MSKDTVITLILVAALAFVLWDDYRVRKAIGSGEVDTTTHIRIVEIPAKAISADSLPAVLAMKSQLKRTQIELWKVRRAKAMVDSMYQAALEKGEDSTVISLPVAILDTTIRRDSVAVDTVHAEYVFPPENAFKKVRIGIAATKAEVVDTSFNKTVVLPPTLWEQVKSGAPMVAAGVIVGVLIMSYAGK